MGTYRFFAPIQDDKTVPEAASKRMFRREQHRKPFIFKESELPEEDYKDYCGSLVTNRNKLIELPAKL